MTKILTGKDILARVRQVCADPGKIYLAVAYWGEGAFDALGLTGDLSRVHVVLNVEHGGTSAAALKELLGAGLGGVKVNDTLHAKIFASPAGAVVGSANASSPGLWIDGSGHDEAAVWLPDGAGALERAKSFYEGRPDAGPDHVNLCRKRFGRRSLASLHIPPAKDGESALDTFLRCRAGFETQRFIVTDKPLERGRASKHWPEARKNNPELHWDGYDEKLHDCFGLRLPRDYHGQMCINLHRSKNGQIGMFPMRLNDHPVGDLHYAVRKRWKDIDGFDAPWTGNKVSFRQSRRLASVIDALVKKGRHCVLGADILAALSPA